MKSLLLASMISTLVSHANPEHLMKPALLPEKCPTVASLASQGLDHVAPVLLASAWIGVKENSHYDTNDSWSLIYMDNTEKYNGKIAMQQLSKKISLHESDGAPEWDQDTGLTVCFYEYKHQPSMVAITPSLYS